MKLCKHGLITEQASWTQDQGHDRPEPLYEMNVELF